MDKIQLAMFFVCGFLLSRLIIKVNLPQAIISRLTANRRLSFSRLLLLLLAASAFLSFFIPNVITVLTMLPLLKLLREDLLHSGKMQSSAAATTLLTLPVIYGANLGGMGSVTSTPANALLVGYLSLDNLLSEHLVSFAVWLVWGLPLVFCGVFGAWLVLTAFQKVWVPSVGTIETRVRRKTGSVRLHQLTIRIGAGIFFASLLLSFLLMRFPQFDVPIVVMTAVMTLVVMYLFFIRGFDDGTGVQTRLMTLRDCYADLPWKGLILLGVVIAIGAVLFFFSDFFGSVAAAGARLVPEGTSPILVFFVFALIVSFATEILSNTVVQLTAFTVCVPLAEQLGLDAVALLIVATLSSTSAYMSPLATGVNGLAFGGMKDMSLWRMLIAGIFMNVVGAFLIALWGTWFIPLLD